MANYTLRWDQNLPAAKRFVILAAFKKEAVLDMNTGLVWERSPQTTGATWIDARRISLEKIVGGQKGWRLPSIPELASLVDPSVAPPGPTLPPGHPFLNVQGIYWSATTTVEMPTHAWSVVFVDGSVADYHPMVNNALKVWCVRGGMNADAY